MGGVLDLNTILVPFSLILTLGYNVFLWHTLKRNPPITAIGRETLTRRAWFRPFKQEGGAGKVILGVQSLRNSLMETILIALTAITINIGLAAFTNNAYNGRESLTGKVFGSQSGQMFQLKYVSASVFLLSSFLSSSMGVGWLIDASILVTNASEGLSCTPPEYAEMVMERGMMLGVVGNRMLWMAFPFLSWMLGPLSFLLSSLALVWALYHLDFSAIPN